MLSEDAIENLIQPILDRQESINMYVIKLIAQRVKEIGELSPSEVYKLERLLKSGSDVQKINKELARITNLQVRDIKRLIKIVAKDAYLDTKPYYDYRNKSFIEFVNNVQLQKVVNAIATQTAQSYVNLSKAQAFMIRDLKHPKTLIPTSLSKTYYSVIDEAVQASQQGVIDYNTAMKRTLQQLTDSGIRRVTYNTETGRRFTQRLDTAVRRNILDGIRAINQGVQNETGKQFGADGKEITVHANSAPDHEPVQGHQFTNEEFDKLQSASTCRDINGVIFAPIARAIGTLNCRHFTYSIIVGFTKPNYTQEQLNEMIRKNHEGVIIDGKHLTLYQCTQVQRNIETKIRYARESQITMQEAGNDKEALLAQQKVEKCLRQYQIFSNKCKLKPRYEKTMVPGYKTIKN